MKRVFFAVLVVSLVLISGVVYAQEGEITGNLDQELVKPENFDIGPAVVDTAQLYSAHPVVVEFNQQVQNLSNGKIDEIMRAKIVLRKEEVNKMAITDVSTALNKVCEEHGYTVVFDKKIVVYNKEGFKDITQEVYDKMIEKEEE